MAEQQGGASAVQLISAVIAIVGAAREAGLLTSAGIKKNVSVLEWAAFAGKAFKLMKESGLSLEDVGGLIEMLLPIAGIFMPKAASTTPVPGR